MLFGLFLLAGLLLAGLETGFHFLPWSNSSAMNLTQFISFVPSNSPGATLPVTGTSTAESFLPFAIPSDISTSAHLIVTPGISLTTGICGVPLDKPIGTDPQYIVHRVARGESLNGYEITYRTSADAILAVNYGLRIPVLVNDVIVIPIDQTDARSLPAFDVYLATGSENSIDALSAKLDVDPDLMVRYNDLVQPCRTFSGWLLVPHQSPTP